jgi:hypothetical protein
VLPGRRRVIGLATRPLRRAADGIVLPDYAALVGQPG